MWFLENAKFIKGVKCKSYKISVVFVNAKVIKTCKCKSYKKRKCKSCIIKLVWFLENAKVIKSVWFLENAKVYNKISVVFGKCKSNKNVKMQKL